MLAWVGRQLDAVPLVVRSLHGRESPWRIDLTSTGGSRLSVVLRAPSIRIDAAAIATNAAALTVAERYGLPAPRLLAADLDGRETGMPATLETVVAGTSVWPAACSPGLLRAAGAALARVHTIGLGPGPALPFRPRPIAVDDFATERREGRMPSTDLLRRADDRVRTRTVPVRPSVFVHGDVWPGNTVVVGDQFVALIDWKTAGVGDPGVDLGELRKQVAIVYDDDAPRYVLEGWEHVAGAPATDVPFWDVTAALNTPTSADGPAVAVRRDAFLRAALAEL